MAEKHDSWLKSVLDFDVVGALKSAATTVADDAKAVGGAVVDAGEAVGGAVVDAGEAVGHAVVDAGKAVGHVAEEAGEAVGHAVVDAGKAVGHVAEEAGKAVGHAAEEVGKFVADKVDDLLHPDHAKMKKSAALTEEFEAQMKRLEAQIKRLKDAGLEAERYEAQAKDLRATHDAAAKQPDLDQRVDALTAVLDSATDAAKRAEADTGRATTTAVEGVGSAVTDMRDTAKKLIDKIDAKDDKKPELTKRLADLDKDIADQAKITDRVAHAKALKDINRTAERLLDDAAAAAKDPDALQATYKKALQDRYGFKVDESKGVSKHNDQVYKMFDKVPEADVTQDRLKKVEYSTKMPDGTANPSAYYWNAGITMGQYGDEDKLPYQDPTTGKAEEPNAFSISTLHELGHSVDDRFQLMNAHGGKDGAGGWKQESDVTPVAQAYTSRFLAGPGKAVKMDPAAVTAAVTAALDQGKQDRPSGVSDPDWALLKPLLATCVSRRVGANPWNAQDDIGGRSYHNSGSGWFSYSTASRAKKLSVSNYQWRSPAEFFAELYAWTYFNSKPPPGPVEPALIDYLYGKATAGQPETMRK